MAAPAEGADFGFDSGSDNDDRVPCLTAKYVEGNVGMSRVRFKKLRSLIGAYRHGVLVIDLGDGGSLSFYKHLKHPGTFVGIDSACGNHYEVPTATVKGRAGNDKVSVYTSMESFVDQSNEPYLHIPANVPWGFQVVGERSFKIVVPPTNVSFTLKKINYTNDNSGIKSDNDSTSTNQNSQVYEFTCQRSGELALFAKGAQSLHRTLSRSLSSFGAKRIIPTSNERTRTAMGLEISAQSALIGRTESVSQFKCRRMSSVGQKEFRCFPLYCYPNAWMTKQDLTVELPRSSKTFHDLRRGAPDEIGYLTLEVLQAVGLPNLDKYSLTDAYVYVVCGSSTFITDIIPDNLNPCWLPRSRRACIIPLHNAHSQVYVAVFDYDGEKTTDDFIGRVVIDVSQLQSGIKSMDITLPLREYSRVNGHRKKGSIRLRLQLNWAQDGERAALLAYFPKQMSGIKNRMKLKPQINSVTVECPDAKSFHNVARTVYAKDIPGRYSKKVKTAVIQEVKLIQKMLAYHTKKTAIDVVEWKTPFLSAYLFSGWMHMVVTNSIRLIPVYIVSLVFIFLLKNYVRYHINSVAGHRTIGGMTRLLLIRQSNPKVQSSKNDQRNNYPILERALIQIFGMPKRTGDSWKFEDHAEFPFSIGSVDHKLSSSEAAAKLMWESSQNERQEEDDEWIDLNYSDDESNNGSKQETDDRLEDYFSGDDYESNDDSDDEYAGAAKKAKNKIGHLPLRSVPNKDYDDDSDDEYVGAAKKAKNKIGHLPLRSVPNKIQKKFGSSPSVRFAPDDNSPPMTGQREVLALPNESGGDREASSVKNLINKWHSKVQRANMHFFDDRVFEADDKGDAEKVLRINRAKNMIAQRINPLMAGVIKIFEIEVSAFRAIFNILFWKDPLLSYCTLVMVLCIMIILLFFPWRKLFFLMGLVGLGPQNYFLRDWIDSKLAKKKNAARQLHDEMRRKHQQQSALRSTLSNLSNSSLLLRNNIQMKPDGKLRKVIVPSAPFRYNRFYDWPPDPATTTIKY